VKPWTSAKNLTRCLVGFGLIGIGLFGALGCAGNGPTTAYNSRGEASANSDRGSIAYRWREKDYPPVTAAYPKVEGAELVKDDELCMTCHEAYVKAFHTNVHHEQSCETCHGPASKHVQTRGKEPGLIVSFKTAPPAQRSEVCLQCHEKDACSPSSPAGKWRTSAHAHGGLSCTDCHRSHYNVPPGTPATKTAMADTGPAQVQQDSFKELQKQPVDQVAIRAESHKLGADTVQTCYRCHQQTQELQRLAHPHQILGPNGFECKTCHDPHGKVKPESRVDLCLNCHKGHPVQSWVSSTHALNGVACVDCHIPHPSTVVNGFPNMQHTNVTEESHMPMAVRDPEGCIPCHMKIGAQFQLPSHHPLTEGKMKCAACHDGHGSNEKNLREPTINLTCYRCHADKQGPFVWEHPPVSENCGICHNPHGTVANNLVKQPTTFLCLRCHSGHRGVRHAPIDNPANGLVPSFYTNCTQCHSQIHGSNLPAATRLGPRGNR
jgi:DmsE family decaheme c-type cytochrome